MKKISLALIGKDIAHSKSQKMYETILNTSINYDLIDCNESCDIPSLKELKSKYKGVSITAPYKKHFLTTTNQSCAVSKLQALNCIEFTQEEYLSHNTDFLALKDLMPKFIKKNIMILGDGNMSRITQLVLDELDVPYKVYSRSRGDNLSTLDFSTYEDDSLIINTCSRSFIFNGKLKESDIFWDYNYDFSDHSHLQKTCNYIDGLDLLFLQAKHAVKIWQLKPE